MFLILNTISNTTSKSQFPLMSASEVKSKNFSMTGGILMVVSRLYAELDRGHQIHSMCHHSVEMQSKSLLEQVNLSQQILANGTSPVHMKPDYLRRLCNLFGTMADSLPDNFNPASMTSTDITNFNSGAAFVCCSYC